MEVLIFTRMVRLQMERGSTQILVINSTGDRNVATVLRARGCEEIPISRLRSPALTKAVIENQFRMMGQYYFRSTDLGLRVQLIAPPPLEANCWLLRSMEDIRRVSDHWIIDLLGPGPDIGQWVPSTRGAVGATSAPSFEPSGAPETKYWEWRPRGSTSASFIEENGSWIFHGNEPEFTDYHWMFVSKVPKLTYCRARQPVFDYLSIAPDASLLIADNSEAARRNWGSIYDTLKDKHEYRFSRERLRTETDKMTFSRDTTKKTAIPFGVNLEERSQRSAEWCDFITETAPNWSVVA